jgi:hypothetical protein
LKEEDNEVQMEGITVEATKKGVLITPKSEKEESGQGIWIPRYRW